MDIYKENSNSNDDMKDEQFNSLEVDSVSIESKHEFDDFLQGLSEKLTSENEEDILFITDSLDKFSQIESLPEFFFELGIHKTIAIFLENNPKEVYSEKLFNFFGHIILMINDAAFCNDLIELHIIELYANNYMNNPFQICFTLHCFSHLAQLSVPARNRIMTEVDLQEFCISDIIEVSIESYNLIHSLCSFGMSVFNCDLLLTLLINGLTLNQEFAFDIILESIYQISYAQEKNWFALFIDKQGKDILISFFENYTNIIISILKRAIETNNILDADLIQLLFYFKAKDELTIEDQQSIDIISEIYLMYAQKGIQYEILFEFDIIGALFFIIDNGSFSSKVNATFSLLIFTKHFIQINDEGMLQAIFSSQLFESCCDLLSSPQVELVLKILLFLIQLVEMSPENSHLFDNELLRNTLEELESHSDPLIAEKSGYLSLLIKNSLPDE